MNQSLTIKRNEFKPVRTRKIKGAGMLLQTANKKGTENVLKATDRLGQDSIACHCLPTLAVHVVSLVRQPNIFCGIEVMTVAREEMLGGLDVISRPAWNTDLVSNKRNFGCLKKFSFLPSTHLLWGPRETG